MIILRNRIYSEVQYKKQPYYTTRQRIGQAATGFGFGAGVGAAMGGLAGGIVGGKTGAKIGATLGGLGMGSALGHFAWGTTSKRSVDSINALRRKQAQQEEIYKKNPRLRYKNLEDPSIEKEFRNIESKYGVKYGDDFYKYLKLRKKLIPILIDLEKKGTPVKDKNELLMEINPRVSSDWIESENSFDPDNINSLIAVNPEMADDTWLVYNFKTGKYGYDSDAKFPDLKSLLLDKLSRDEDFIKDQEEQKGDLEFIKKYRDLINSSL